MEGFTQGRGLQREGPSCFSEGLLEASRRRNRETRKWILELMEVRDGVLGQGDTSRSGEKWANLTFILKAEVVRCD